MSQPSHRTRFRTNPSPGQPPKGCVDLYWDREAGSLVTEDYTGTKVAVGAEPTAANTLAAIEALSSDQQDDARDALGFSSAPVAVANAAARKNAASYTADKVIAGLKVIQADLPDVVWELINPADITSDSNWAGTPRTNSSGALPLSGVEVGYAFRKITSVSQARVRNRVTQVQCVGAVTAGNSLAVTIQGPPANSGSSKVVNVTVAVGDTTPQWQDKVVAALNADTAFNPHYTFYAVGGIIQMQEVVKTASDVFSCNIAVGNTTGVTAKSSSQTQQIAFVSCGSITIPAAYVNSTQKFIVSGKVNYALSTTDTTASRVYWAMRPRMSTSGVSMVQTTVGSYFVLTTDATNGGATSDLSLFASPAKFVDVSGKLRFSLAAADTVSGTVAGLEYKRIRSSGALTAGDLSFTSSSVAELAPNGDCSMEIVASFFIDGSGSGGTIANDIRIIPVTSWT